GESIRARRVHIHVSRSRYLADEHPLAHRIPRLDEERRSVLEREERERDDRPVFHRDERAAYAPAEWTRPRPVLEKAVMDDASAAGVREKLRPVAKESARRDTEHDAHHPLSGIAHVHHLAAA